MTHPPWLPPDGDGEGDGAGAGDVPGDGAEGDGAGDVPGDGAEGDGPAGGVDVRAGFGLPGAPPEAVGIAATGCTWR
jgi:hypothetical protein